MFKPELAGHELAIVAPTVREELRIALAAAAAAAEDEGFVFRAPVNSPPATADLAAGSSEESAESTQALEAVIRDLSGQRDIEHSLEALLVSTRVPLRLSEIAEALHLGLPAVEQSLDRLEQALNQRALGLFSRQKDGERAFILDIKAAYRVDVAAVAPPLLKPAVTETLALIAINQPIPQARLVRERGSGVYDHVKELVVRGLVVKLKKGRSFQLRTTDSFAAEFGLANDPELIRRALARAAAVEGTPDVIGSERIHFGDDTQGLAEALKAEAHEVSAQLPVVSPPAVPVLPPVLSGEDCLVSGGEAPPPEEGPSAAGPFEAQPAAVSSPSQEDCLVSGGEAPQPTRSDENDIQVPVERRPQAPPVRREIAVEKKKKVRPEANETETKEEEPKRDLSRLEKLLAFTGDASATTDDW